MKITKRQLRRIVREELNESLEDRVHGTPDEDETGWKEIPPEELEEALKDSIYDLYKYVHGIRPRWIYEKEMSIKELKKMHHRLTTELEREQQEEPEPEWEDERELMQMPEEGEEYPKATGMGRARRTRVQPRGSKTSPRSTIEFGESRITRHKPIKEQATMKITKRQLRRIIKEASRVRWQSGDVVDEAGAGGYYDAINQLVHDSWADIEYVPALDGMQEVEYVKQALKNLLADLEIGRF